MPTPVRDPAEATPNPPGTQSVYGLLTRKRRVTDGIRRPRACAKRSWLTGRVYPPSGSESRPASRSSLSDDRFWGLGLEKGAPVVTGFRLCNLKTVAHAGVGLRPFGYIPWSSPKSTASSNLRSSLAAYSPPVSPRAVMAWMSSPLPKTSIILAPRTSGSRLLRHSAIMKLLQLPDA